MPNEVILGKLKDLLGSDSFTSMQAQVDTIDNDTSLINDLALDSIQILELIVAIENEFAFSCNPRELNLEMFDKLSLLVDYIERNSNKN